MHPSLLNPPTLLSHSLDSDTPLFGGKRGVTFVSERSIASGHSCNQTGMTLSLHSGTHVETPYHFLPDGRGVTDFPPAHWIFESVALINIPTVDCQLIDFSPRWLDGLTNPATIELILLKTGFEQYRHLSRYWEGSPGLDPSLAEKLTTFFPKLRALGLDTLSVTSATHREEGRKAHTAFLSRNILLIEDMGLDALSVAPRLVLVSPLMVKGADGAPATIWAF